MLIRTFCPHCKTEFAGELSFPHPKLLCLHCHQEVLSFCTEYFLEGKKLDQCPFCGASHLYRRKDFNQNWGIILVISGVLLAYFTYGLSLLLVTLIDFFLFRRVKEVGICYQCKSEFRNSLLIDQLEPFNLQVFDYYKNLPNQR
jgi:hypothetical protein